MNRTRTRTAVAAGLGLLGATAVAAALTIGQPTTTPTAEAQPRQVLDLGLPIGPEDVPGTTVAPLPEQPASAPAPSPAAEPRQAHVAAATSAAPAGAPGAYAEPNTWVAAPEPEQVQEQLPEEVIGSHRCADDTQVVVALDPAGGYVCGHPSEVGGQPEPEAPTGCGFHDDSVPGGWVATDCPTYTDTDGQVQPWPTCMLGEEELVAEHGMTREEAQAFRAGCPA